MKSDKVAGTIDMEHAVESFNSDTDFTNKDSIDDVSSYYSASNTARRTKFFASLVFVMGTVVSCAFLWFGITSVQNYSDNEFNRRANDLVKVIEASFRDYVVVSMSLHNVCRKRETTKEDFRDLYEYIIAGGIEFQAVQCVRNVTHDERAEYEAISRKYYSKRDPNFDYQGFRGFNYDPNTGDFIGTGPRSEEAPFYFPIVHNEPLVGNEAAVNLDLFSSPNNVLDIELALNTMKPVVGKRQTLAQETGNAYGVILRNPGIPLSSSPKSHQLRSQDLSAVVIRIPNLLTRVSRLQEQSLAVYLYEVHSVTRFLGGAAFDVNQDEDGGKDTKIEILEEQELESLRGDYEPSRFYEEEVQLASARWKIVVVPVDDTYKAQISFVLFGGLMILCGGLGLALWMCSNMRRVAEIHQVKAEGEVERAIVSSMFPENIRNRLLEDAEERKALKRQRAQMRRFDKEGNGPSGRLTSEGVFGSRPIAEFHPDVTIMCADLVGFTAWSSVREASQVFTLLELIYHSFDTIARRLHVFKVETVGDCYVAAAGIPDASKDDPITMALFATECLHKMHVVTKELETTLGPDTGDLNIRIGMHSGACTAGVLRGDKGRFQLFGDTINTASRMEHTGLPSKIQVSADTADLIIAAGKGCWLKIREDEVIVKGKGRMKTYWLNTETDNESTTSFSVDPNHVVALSVDSGTHDTRQLTVRKRKSRKRKAAKKTEEDEARTNRLVNWNVEELSKLLRQIIARRMAKSKKSIFNQQDNASSPLPFTGSKTPLEEVKDIITLPQFDPVEFRRQTDPEQIDLDSDVVEQLTSYVKKIASMYKKNPFHNFEHASHVAMSVTKLLSRIVNPKQVVAVNEGDSNMNGANSSRDIASSLHDYTFGITSDPMTQFAAFFAALIHDVDHPGVPNTTLIVEEPDLAKQYQGKSLAEQNSVDLAWNILMKDEYQELRTCLFGNQEKELLHFRQLIVNMVMATDVMDKELNGLRKARWNKAFAEVKSQELESTVDSVNRKATIVIEHLIQASDVSHTMQHWRIYSKWNECLFMELYHAYKMGRIEKDPSEGWYEGEKGFLDFYVLPLAKKLDTCGVFGVTSDEFRYYASENRKEWELKGREMVEGYITRYQETFQLGVVRNIGKICEMGRQSSSLNLSCDDEEFI